MAGRDILNGYDRMPTWYEDKSQLDIFLKGVRFNALRKGANKQNVDAGLVITGDNHMILKYAGALENQGASFIEQQVACADFLVKLLVKVDQNTNFLAE